MVKFAEDTYVSAYKPTVGIDFKCKKIKINDTVVKLQVWDTAGQERFRTISQKYYQRADGVILAYDCSNAKSFENLNSWIEQIATHAKEGVQKVIIGTKCDKPESQKVVNQINGEAYAQNLGLKHFETSALEGTNIDLVFTEITQLILNYKDKNPKPTEQNKNIGRTTFPISDQ